jgi:hypothetical protein
VKLVGELLRTRHTPSQALVTEVRKEVKRLQEELEAAKVPRCNCRFTLFSAFTVTF